MIEIAVVGVQARGFEFHVFAHDFLRPLSLLASATWKVRADPPRSISATIGRLLAGPACCDSIHEVKRLQRLANGLPSLRMLARELDLAVRGFVGFHDLAFAAHRGSEPRGAIAMRMRCHMNHAVLSVTPKVR